MCKGVTTSGDSWGIIFGDGGCKGIIESDLKGVTTTGGDCKGIMTGGGD